MPSVGFVKQHRVMTTSVEADSDGLWIITQQLTTTAFIHKLNRHLSCIHDTHSTASFVVTERNSVCVYVCEQSDDASLSYLCLYPFTSHCYYISLLSPLLLRFSLIYSPTFILSPSCNPPHSPCAPEFPSNLCFSCRSHSCPVRSLDWIAPSGSLK